MKKVLMSVLAMSAITVSIHAGCTATGCSNVTIDKLYMTATGTLYVGTSGDESKLNCTSPGGGKYMSLAEGDVGKNAMYSLLLTAKTTKQKVKLRIVDGDPKCKVMYVTN